MSKEVDNIVFIEGTGKGLKHKDLEIFICDFFENSHSFLLIVPF